MVKVRHVQKIEGYDALGKRDMNDMILTYSLLLYAWIRKFVSGAGKINQRERRIIRVYKRVWARALVPCWVIESFLSAPQVNFVRINWFVVSILFIFIVQWAGPTPPSRPHMALWPTNQFFTSHIILIIYSQLVMAKDKFYICQ